MTPRGEPLLVFGPRSLAYDFGEHHPLTPRRFGPGISLLEAVGATPGLAPEPATDDELGWVHTRRYVETVRRYSEQPWLPGAMGIGLSDNPAFAGMHEASAAVAGGSLAAMRAILDGHVRHAQHPGGGLHHAMPERAAGFCIYDDPAVAIAAARRAGLRVLYVDLDVHHGDGVQAMFIDDPGVLTVSFHESGRYLFPGTGFPDELGRGTAAGTSVNVPFEPYAGERAWQPVVLGLVPELAASFGPDVVVSQHGADAHAWDPLAHLRVTITAQWAAARMVDAIAHRWAEGRWLATGGGGYDVYRVVPRTWALTWLAGAHREPPVELPVAWRARWASEAAAHGQAPIPPRFLDEPNAGLPISTAQAEAERRSLELAGAVRSVVVPAVVRAAVDRGWWRPAIEWPVPRPLARPRPGPTAPDPASRSSPAPSAGASLEVRAADRALLDDLVLADRVLAIARADDARAVLLGALADPRTAATVALAGSWIVGLALSASEPEHGRSLVALGVAPAFRRRGVAGRLLVEHAAAAAVDGPLRSLVTVAERDPHDPLDRALRARIAGRLLDAAGFARRPTSPEIAAIDRGAITAVCEGP